MADARADIDEAVKNMGGKIGARKELEDLPQHLLDGEKVEALVAGDNGPGSGLLVLTQGRVFFTHEGLIRKDFLVDVPFAEITGTEWDEGLNLGKLTLQGTDPITVKGIDKDGGRVFVARLRALTGVS